eukprot:GHVT01049028.1.p1 GENE.GHVT01049028.1~~GHVT01049028.1.p1  ORF type:complete len:146 (-),score=9.23 GHVT01049028.1:624-1061(-)
MQASGRHTALTGAFYATLQQNQQVNTGDKLTFDTARYNPGGDFNVGSGDYRCPVNGTYILFATVTTAEVASSVSFGLYINGVRRPPNVIPRNSYSQYSSGSTMWVTSCSIGQNIWVQVIHDNLGTGCQVQGDDFTTFSGFLLSAN